MSNILLNKKWEETISQKHQCFKSQRKAKELFHITETRDHMTKNTRWSQTGGGNAINDSFGIIDKIGIRVEK